MNHPADLFPRSYISCFRSPPVAACALLASLVLAWPCVAQADDRPTPRSTEKHAELGARYSRLGLYEQALPELQATFAASGTAADGLLLADCARRLGELDTAYAALVKVRDIPKLSPKNTKLVAAALAEMDAQTGTLTVTAPPGATVEVGGHVIGTAPLPRAHRRLPGSVVVRVTSQATTPWERVVEVTAHGTMTVEATLLPASTGGYLFVSEEKGLAVHVFLDDKDVGPTPWHDKVPSGAHQLVLKGEHLEAPSSVVEVEPGKQQTVVLTAHATVGHLHVSTTPTFAAILVDGVAAGVGHWDVDVPVGKHEVKGQTQGYESASQSVELAPAETKNIVLELSKIEPPKYIGFYGGFVLGYLSPVGGAPSLCGGQLEPVTGCSSSGYGGGMTLRLGYNTGYVGIEGVLMPSVAYYTESLHHPGTATPAGLSSAATYDESATIYAPALFLGAGPRFTTHGSFARFTVGVQGGAELRVYVVSRQLSNGLTDSTTDSTVQFAPAGAADIGVLLGSTPGPKFFIGPVLYTRFLTSPVVLAGSVRTVSSTTGTMSNVSSVIPPMTVANGSSLFLGGMVGIFFGR